MSGYVSDVFKDDSFHLKSLVAKYVKITTIHDECREGVIFTIDPMTESIVLVNDKNGKTSLEVIMRHVVKIVDVIDSADNNNILLNSLFSVSNVVYSKDEVCDRKSNVMKLLEKHRIPFVENGEVLKIHDTLEILPPYGIEQCISNNTVILSRVKNLIAEMAD